MGLKRMMALLLAAGACALMLSACAKPGAEPARNQQPAKELTQPFESKVAIKYKEIDATARIAKDAPGYCKITFESPEALRDMAVEFTSEQVNVDYKKLHASFRPESVPGTAVTKLLVSAINTATKGTGVEVAYKDDVFTLTGMMESGEFTMTLDAKSGNLIRVAVPADGFEATFSDFQFIAG